MPEGHSGKQRWREIPASSDDERWILDNPPPLPPPPSPSPSLPRRAQGRPLAELPPIESEREAPTEPRRTSEADVRRDSFRPPDEQRLQAVRHQRASSQPRPVGANTLLAAVLAVGAIALIVILTIYLARQT